MNRCLGTKHLAVGCDVVIKSVENNASFGVSDVDRVGHAHLITWYLVSSLSCCEQPGMIVLNPSGCACLGPRVPLEGAMPRCPKV
jgi:hypothetical protein